MKREKFFLAILGFCLMLCWSFTACTVAEMPMPPTPIPPSSYESLPKPGVVDCEEDSPMNQMPINLWQHEAHFPLDPSDSGPDRGGDVGNVMFRQEIIVLDFAWSSYDEEFWFLIETPEGTQGWITGEYIILQNE